MLAFTSQNNLVLAIQDGKVQELSIAEANKLLSQLKVALASAKIQRTP